MRYCIACLERIRLSSGKDLAQYNEFIQALEAIPDELLDSSGDPPPPPTASSPHPHE